MKIIYLVAVVVLLMFGSHAAAQDGGASIVHDDLERTYYVFVPDDYDEEEPLPLVIGLHGAGGSAAEMVFFTNIDDIANENGFILVYANAADSRWSYLDVPLDPQDTVHDDEGFISALIDTMSEQYAIDENRVYVFGFSNGGLMTVRLRCTLTDRLAAVAAIGATMTVGLSQQCLEAEPLPFFIALGTEDTAFPWQGVMQVENGTMYGSFSVAQTMSFMASLNGCAVESEVNPVAIQGSPVGVLRQSHTNCADHNEVLLYALVELDHTWPATPVIVLESGETGSIEQAMWEFFARHEREG